MQPCLVGNKWSLGIKLFIDGGIRRGRDVYKALALGADMVFVGRPIIFGLTAKVNNKKFHNFFSNF